MKMSVVASVSLTLTAFPGAVWAAEQSDADLVALCVGEMKSRQPADEVQQNTQVAASRIERNERQIVVHIQVTEAEGRRVTASCIVRNGKIFDYRDE